MRQRYNGAGAGRAPEPWLDGPVGIIYLAWQGKETEPPEMRALFAMEWQHFVEQAVAEHNGQDMNVWAAGGALAGSPGIDFGYAAAGNAMNGEAKVKMLFQPKRLNFVWMRDDLYLYLPLPLMCGREELVEELLLETGSRFKREWEQRFLAAAPSRPRAAGLQLHVGVALLGGEPDEAERWYEGVKRALVHGQSAGATDRSLRRKAFDLLLRERKLVSVYQPILSLRLGNVYGYEALSRFPDKRWFDGPQQLFDFASEEGMMYALDRLARERAIEGSCGLDKCQKLFINITAQIMNDPLFTPGQTLHLLERFGLSPQNVVFEITERSSFEDFAAAKKVLDHYRSQGYQIAIDDAGAGYSSLQSIVELQPDFIKIDRSLIRNIHLDPMKEQIVRIFTEFAAKMGISLIAEGIELEEELSHMRAMGVEYAQGFLLGRPQASIC